ncbi:MAG: beta-galactosidase [Limisphaerales bacterium]
MRGSETAPLAPRIFSHPDRIRYDGQCLTIDGKDVFIYSGSFHYFRCPKKLWPDRFQKMKEAGFNCVETYVPWNYSERQMPSGLKDFSKVNLRDLDDWLTLAQAEGFYVIVRPGPYICAEWATGGFPQWLLTKKPKHPLRSEGWLRSDDPVFLKWSRHWYDAVCPVIAKHQITRQPPGSAGVILVQLENEYDFSVPFADAVKINQVKALAEFARADGIDVPLITCWTHQVRGSTDPVLRQVFDCCNFYPRWNVDGIQKDIEKLRREQPDAPLGTTELQGGWFSQVGGKLSQDQDGITGAEINNLTLFAIQNGETLLNYYMLVGGSNFGDWAARGVTTTYDYDAPIREWGGVGDRYQRVRAIGHFLQRHGAQLARSVPVHCDASTVQKDVTIAERRAPDGSRYFFVRTDEHVAPRAGTATVREQDGGVFVFHYSLEPFGSKIFYLPPGANDARLGQWLPKAPPAIQRPATVPAPVIIKEAKVRADPGPVRWRKLKAGETLAQAGIYDSRFVFYQARIPANAMTNLIIEYPTGDDLAALVNGRFFKDTNRDSGTTALGLPRGFSSVELLYENHGFPNFGAQLEQPGGIISAWLRKTAGQNEMAITDWRMHQTSGAMAASEVEPGFADGGWESIAAANVDANQMAPDTDAVFRSKIEMSSAVLRGSNWNLNFGRIDDSGLIYVNGTRVGKAADWSRPYSFDVTKELRAGKNVIAVIVHNDSGEGGIGLVTLADAPKSRTALFRQIGDAAGFDQQWWRADWDDTGWKTVPMGAASKRANLLTWYRMNFHLPPRRPDVWVPWRLRLRARGDGFLYLNGHSLGRYWQAGPQRDFFLPDNWLNFSPGKTNVIALDLFPVDGSVSVQSAAVEPYQDFAEKR